MLRLLQRRRAADAPLNGIVVTISVAELLDTPGYGHWTSHAARLTEARARLGHWLPVYVVISQLDLLRGFEEYFGGLSAAETTYPLGFSLAGPRVDKAGEVLASAWLEHCRQELGALVQRVQESLNAALQQEADLWRRKALFRFPREFARLADAVVAMLQELVGDGTPGPRQSVPMLRGVYFISARQGEGSVVSDPSTVFQRLSTGGAYERFDEDSDAEDCIARYADDGADSTRATLPGRGAPRTIGPETRQTPTLASACLACGGAQYSALARVVLVCQL